MEKLKENATLQEERDYFKERSVEFAIHNVQMQDKYTIDTFTLMLLIVDNITGHEDLLEDLGMTPLLDEFKKNIAVIHS